MEKTIREMVDKNKRQPFKARYIHHGQNVQLFRRRAGMSQKELADKIGKSQQFISTAEQQDVIDDDILKLIANALEIDPQYLSEWSTDTSQNIFNIEKFGEGEGSTNMVGTNNFETNHEVHIYPLDKVCELYERMLIVKDKQITSLEEAVRKLEMNQNKFEYELKKLRELIVSMNQ